MSILDSPYLSRQFQAMLGIQDRYPRRFRAMLGIQVSNFQFRAMLSIRVDGLNRVLGHPESGMHIYDPAFDRSSGKSRLHTHELYSGWNNFNYIMSRHSVFTI